MAIFNVIHWEVLDINPGERLTIEINAAEQFDVRWYYLIAHAPGVGWTKRVGDRVAWIPEVVPGLDRIAALDLVPPMEEINILAQRTTSCDECLDFTVTSCGRWRKTSNATTVPLLCVLRTM